MEIIKVRRNFQLTIPQSLRRKLKLAVGDYLEVDLEDDAIIVKPVKVMRTGRTALRLLKAREDAYSALDEIWEKMKDEKPEEVENLVDEAIREVREE